MKLIRVSLTLWLLLLTLLVPALSAPAFRLEADLMLTEDPLPFGKPAELVLTLSWPDGVDFSPPEAKELKLPDAELIDSYAIAESGDGQRKSVEYHIVFTRFEPGEFDVGPVTVSTPEGKVESPKRTMTFSGAKRLEADKPGEIRDNKSVVSISTADFWRRALSWFLATLSVLALLYGLVNYFGLLDRFRSPKALALKRLKRLSKKAPDAQALVLGCVEVVRTYLEQAYELKTRESTSTEIDRQLRMDNRCLQVRETAAEVLSFGDQVKFANRTASAPEAADLHQKLVTILSEERKVPKK
jgi:hypothetical protein